MPVRDHHMDWHLHGGGGGDGDDPSPSLFILTKAEQIISHYSINKSKNTHFLIYYLSLDEKDGIFSIKMKLKSSKERTVVSCEMNLPLFFCQLFNYCKLQRKSYTKMNHKLNLGEIYKTCEWRWVEQRFQQFLDNLIAVSIQLTWQHLSGR
uniref:Uncharacterized protein n=1 Tax=Solanum tuberosum TaxID=4113 RepID=M1CMZ9_SOLTU